MLSKYTAEIREASKEEKISEPLLTAFISKISMAGELLNSDGYLQEESVPNYSSWAIKCYGLIGKKMPV